MYSCIKTIIIIWSSLLYCVAVPQEINNWCHAERCRNNETCTYHPTKGFKCICNNEYRRMGGKCVVDLCIKWKRLCHKNAHCNMPEERVLDCICWKGYSGNGRDCYDFDECKDQRDKPYLKYCPKNSKCTNTIGSYYCQCDPGFYYDHPGCVKLINECENNTTTSSPCHANATCTDTQKSYECSCKDGYRGNGTYCEGTAYEEYKIESLEKKKVPVSLFFIVIILFIVVISIGATLISLKRKKYKFKVGVENPYKF